MNTIAISLENQIEQNLPLDMIISQDLNCVFVIGETKDIAKYMLNLVYSYHCEDKIAIAEYLKNGDVEQDVLGILEDAIGIEGITIEEDIYEYVNNRLEVE